MIDYLKEVFNIDNSYKKLWEEQNVQLDEQKLRLHRKDKQIKKLELTVERLEKEITELKAHRRPKKTK